MLRASSLAFGYELNLRAIGDPSVDVGIPGGNLLLSLVDAVLGVGEAPVPDAQRAIVDELGPAALVDAASVFGNFEMMNRVAEGTGIPIPAQGIERMREEIEVLGLNTFVKD